MKFLAAILSTFMRQTKLVGFSWDRRGSVEDKETIFFLVGCTFSYFISSLSAIPFLICAVFLTFQTISNSSGKEKQQLGFGASRLSGLFPQWRRGAFG